MRCIRACLLGCGKARYGMRWDGKGRDKIRSGSMRGNRFEDSIIATSSNSPTIVARPLLLFSLFALLSPKSAIFALKDATSITLPGLMSRCTKGGSRPWRYARPRAASTAMLLPCRTLSLGASDLGHATSSLPTQLSRDPRPANSRTRQMLSAPAHVPA